MICPGCGARLLSRATRPKPPPPEPVGLGDHPPEVTLPTEAPPKKKKKPGEDTAPAGTRGPAPPAPPAGPDRPAGPFTSPYEEILAEVRALRVTQEEILRLLRSGAAGVGKLDELDEPAPQPAPAPITSAFEGFHATVPVAPPLRSRRRKTVLLIDDDPFSRQAAVAAFEQAEVPVQAAADGNAGIEAIAQEKPDVIILELALTGDMAGKDVINMIKATMDWVDIPIVLYTRMLVESQKEARTIHGADEVIVKAAGPEALVARVIAIFRSR